jgi:cation diffusion facilitator CzcD-associated flavoprotein CzcO
MNKTDVRIVVIGGGTGGFTLLGALKNYSKNITALVNMADDGGSTGQLRDELGVLPPGDVRILTFSAEWFQKFKLSLVPQLASLPYDIIQEAKGAYIAEHFPQAQGWLVDDKLDTDLPPGIRAIWLDRSKAMDIERQNDIIIVNSLKHVKEVL